MLLFAGGAAATGLQVDLLVCNTEGPLAQSVDPRVNLIDLKVKRVRSAFFPVIRYLKTHRPTALFATIQHANVMAIAAVRMSGVKTRVIVRQSTSHLSESKRTAVHTALLSLIPWVYPLAHGVIAVSEGVKAQLCKVNPKLEVGVLPNPVLTDEFDALSNESIDHPWFRTGEPPVLLAAGRLVKFKFFDVLLRTYAGLPERTQYRLMILGEGPEREHLTSLARELGIADRVQLPGFIMNPLPYMRRARLFILSSSYEGMPNVLLQAIACGTAVVATDCNSGPREILEGGRLGPLVKVGDEADLASGIQRALASGPHPEAASLVRKRFSVASAVEEYLELAGVKIPPLLEQGVA